MPDDVEFATKITLGRRMLTRALDAGVPGRVGDRGRVLRRRPRPAPRPASPRLGYVLAVAKSHRVNIGGLHGTARADHIAATLPGRPGTGSRAGEGAKGDRDYDWAWVRITPPADEATGLPLAAHPPPHHRRRAGLLPLLVTRHRSASPPWSGSPAPGGRSRSASRAGKGEVGLDQHQVRRWNSWHRYTTLAMLAHAILAVIAAARTRQPHQATSELIPLTVNEIRRLFAKLITNTIRTISLLAALVRMATPPPSTRPDQPLPHPRRQRTSTSIYITFWSWTTSACFISAV